MIMPDFFREMTVGNDVVGLLLLAQSKGILGAQAVVPISLENSHYVANRPRILGEAFEIGDLETLY